MQSLLNVLDVEEEKSLGAIVWFSVVSAPTKLRTERYWSFPRADDKSPRERGNNCVKILEFIHCTTFRLRNNNNNHRPILEMSFNNQSMAISLRPGLLISDDGIVSAAYSICNKTVQNT